MKRRVLSILVIGILLLGACGEPAPAPQDETVPVQPAPEKPTTYTLSVTVSPSGAGSVSPSTGQYKRGRKVTLTVIPSSNYGFDYWSGDASGSSTTITITMDSDKSITAHFVSTTPTPMPTGAELKIHFIDVGQGDAILIDLGETEVLIDGGGKSPGVTAYLSNYVDGQLEVMVGTHPHADHIGGLIAVLEAFEVQEIWHNGDSSTSQTYAQFKAAVDAEGAEVNIARQGNEVIAGELILVVLSPATLAGSTNENSIVLNLSYGEVDFLFTGDAGQEAEASMLGAGLVPSVEVLKVGHHGSRTASSQSFLAVAMPKVAVYMAGEGNRYGHPHEETIAALTLIGAEIYGTEVYGTIIITTDGEEYGIETEQPS